MVAEKAISKLLEHTTTKPIPEGNLDTWVKVLEPLGDELAVAAALRVVRSETKPFAVQGRVKLPDEKLRGDIDQRRRRSDAG